MINSEEQYCAVLALLLTLKKLDLQSASHTRKEFRAEYRELWELCEYCGRTNYTCSCGSPDDWIFDEYR